jgi:glyoxylase I family protein
VVVLREPLPGTPADDRFSERRIGLDHISFKVETASELEGSPNASAIWAPRFGTLEHDPHGGGLGLAFLDPDNIQLECYASPSLP